MAKFKGKCETDYMMESKRVYGKYLESERECKARMKEVNSMRELTSEYKQEEVDKMQEKISMRRADLKGTLHDLEEGFANWVYDFADLTGEGLDRKLVTALSSGINYTQQELLYMAKKYGNEQANARLLHDYAKEQGIELHNYVSPEEKIASYKAMNSRLGISADDENNMSLMRMPLEGVDNLIDKHFKEMDISVDDMDVCETAKSIEEEIARDMRQRRVEADANIDDKFLEGFGAEKPKTDPEYYEPKEKDENGEVEYP